MMMDISSWLREVRMSTNTSDWNAAFVNNRLDEAANEIERLRNKVRWLEMCENTVVKQNAEIERLREEMADLKYIKTYFERAYMAARRTLDSKGIHMDYFLSRADYEAELKEGE